MDNMGGLFDEAEVEEEESEDESEEGEGSFIALDDSNVTLIFNNIQVDTHGLSMQTMYTDCILIAVLSLVV